MRIRVKPRSLGWSLFFCFMAWVGCVYALEPIDHQIAFDTSTGTTSFNSQFSFNSRTTIVLITPVGDDVYVTFDGSTTPIKDKHTPFWETNNYVLRKSQANKITFTGGGNSAGWLNVIEMSD
jgi:hypothetical protein